MATAKRCPLSSASSTAWQSTNRTVRPYLGLERSQNQIDWIPCLAWARSSSIPLTGNVSLMKTGIVPGLVTARGRLGAEETGPSVVSGTQGDL